MNALISIEDGYEADKYLWSQGKENSWEIWTNSESDWNVVNDYITSLGEEKPLTITDINDFFWFELDFIVTDLLGYEDYEHYERYYKGMKND